MTFCLPSTFVLHLRRSNEIPVCSNCLVFYWLLEVV